MLPDRVSNPGPLTYESGALPIALRGPAQSHQNNEYYIKTVTKFDGQGSGTNIYKSISYNALRSQKEKTYINILHA